MKHLIIFAHPNNKSLNANIKKNLYQHLLRQGHEVEIRDLYKLAFNPVLSLADMEGQRQGQVANDVAIEQKYITWSECITFIYPIWWTGLPAILKGYIDRVFSYGFAYCYQEGVQKGLLSGKDTIIINTHGKSQAEYESMGMDNALALTSDKGIYSYCGLNIKQHYYFDNSDKANAETIQLWNKIIAKDLPC
ncbi:NAD(P)H-dependent oxidoreductase [Colwellia sp. MSW7]|uniref:NAD(P)H-dependent oxidoreductase n=1 Tax=Colwellia maritima TaxID=2912588 RepID=A0ABS9WXK9_9GAMM|nr:NAD(P)H-dependent oxidoreductase [Colwellia maritima]MCI2282683.1 NAD(P)H-dependent oxidoreductase [Colwellia maritima]